jgi:glucose 1-dehydrogenase
VIAVGVTAGEAGTMRLLERPVPEPGDDQVLVRTVQVGVCGTDRSIAEGLYGTAPAGSDELVIGHEALGVVARSGGGHSKGALVSATVRRGCDRCPNCKAGETDACTTGTFKERGIVGLDGFAAEYFIERAENLVPIPASLGSLGVLAEPASVAAKGIRQVRLVGGRQAWEPRRAIVLGVGAIGVLTVQLLRLAGIETWAMARSASTSTRAQFVQAVGARYISRNETSLSELAAEIGGADLIMEAAGDPVLSAEAIRSLAPNGVLCLRGIAGTGPPANADVGALNGDLVLYNKTIIGCTNASRRDWENGVKGLAAARGRWPDALEAMAAHGFSPDSFNAALAATDAVKNTIEFSDLDLVSRR